MELSKWLPTDFLQHSAQLPGHAFNRSYGDTAFLVVKLEHARPRLVTGLAATSTLDPLPLKLDSDEMGTDVASTFLDEDRVTAVEGADDQVLTAERILERLGRKRCFVVAIRPRPGHGTDDAMSVGRSPSNDIVLRDPSISKHHAWLVRGDNGRLRVCDLGSKNGTQLNGQAITNRDVPIRSGDTIVFGHVEATFCEAAVLHRVLRSTLPPAANV
ncbi:MAG: FHA domain-containing protein [Myxococcales bacterium]|nr:FHA domain-containing protein [Myxococcales bacterium]